MIGTTKFYYTPGNGNENLGTLECSIFLLSATEFNKIEPYWTNEEGSPLPISNMLEIAYINGVAVEQWTRSPVFGTKNMVVYLYSQKGFDVSRVSNTEGARPVFTLPSTTKFDLDTNVIIG